MTVFLGACLGLVLWQSPFAGDPGTLNVAVVQVIFSWLLQLFALPIIIFESGWSLRIRDFVSQFGYIMFFAIFGTVISSVVIAALLVNTSSWHGVDNWRTAFAYASLMASVDPVSTLATFGHLNVDPLLYILVFGESQINDAVAITLFRALNNDSAHSGTISMVWHMVEVFCGSVFVGILLAFIYILILRLLSMGQSPAQAILMIFISCFFTFSLTEELNLSGIIAVLFNSIIMGAYTGSHLNKEEMTLASFLLKQMSSLADTMIFLTCGVMAIFVITSEGRGMRIGLMMCLFCFIGRVLGVVPLGFLSNGIKRLVACRLPKERDHIISWKHLLMMCHAGLRGGVSLVMVLEMGDWVDEIDGPGTKESLVNGTFVLIATYLFVFASTTGAALRVLKLPMGDQVVEGQTLYDKSDQYGMPWRMAMYVQAKCLRPLLVGPAKEADGAGRIAPGCPGLLFDLIEKTSRNRARIPIDDDEGCRRSSVFDLFGTQDPAHVDDLDVSSADSDVVDEGSSSESDETSASSGLGDAR